MKRIFTIIVILMALTACAAPQSQAVLDAAATDIPQAGMPNPASVYCTQTGNKLEIRTAADGSQYGICVFPDGGACDEWAYFRGACGPAAQTSPTPTAVVEAATPAGDAAAAEKSPTPAAPVETATPVSSGAQGGDAPGSFMPPETEEEIADWWGVIKGTSPGAQFDDYFERQDLGQIIFFGIDSMNPAVQAQIKALRNSGKVVHLYGTLLSNVPDYNGSQIRVARIEVEE